MAILVLSHTADDHLSLVIPHLQNKEFTLYADKPFLFHFDSSTKNGQIEQDSKHINFSEISVIWNRRAFSTPGPELPHQKFTRLEIRMCVVQSLMNSIPAERWINHPDAVTKSQDKLCVLNYALECGLSCPDWIVSNNHSEILSFAKKHGDWIVLKPLIHIPEAIEVVPSLIYARPVSTDQLSIKISNKKIFPMFVQQMINKSADWRVTVIDDYVSAVRMTGCPAESMDFRRAYDKLAFENKKLNNALIGSIKNLMFKLKIRYAAIDMVEDVDSGELFFLEVNPSGQYGWMEAETGLGGQSRFSGQLARILLEECT